jgi:beta-aspartyl-peptidase (threonine type)
MDMRPSFIVSSLILLCALGAPAQNSRSTTERAVRQVLERQQEAWNRHALESFMAGYWNSPELTFFSGAKISSGWQATIERYRKTYQSEGREMGKLEFSDLKIQALAPMQHSCAELGI